MDSSKKTLYLVNWERCARGIRLFEGIDPTLKENVTKPYAQYLTFHQDKFTTHPHTADGRDVKQRMQDAGIIFGKDSEYYAENITLITIYNNQKFDQIYEPEALSVFSWLYQDKEENYGHRDFVLSTGYVDNTGLQNQE